MVELTNNNKTIKYTSPYDVRVAKACRNLGGKWNGNAWEFNSDEDTLQALKKITLKTFGFSLDSPKGVAYVTISEDVSAAKEPYVVGGMILSQAKGRDTGAKTGTGVQLLEGDINSGGSFKNWESKIAAHSRFKIHQFPLEYDVAQHDDSEYITIKIKTATKKEQIVFDFDKLTDKLEALSLDTKQIQEILECAN
jgi:hypothetical protein